MVNKVSSLRDAGLPDPNSVSLCVIAKPSLRGTELEAIQKNHFVSSSVENCDFCHRFVLSSAENIGFQHRFALSKGYDNDFRHRFALSKGFDGVFRHRFALSKGFDNVSPFVERRPAMRKKQIGFPCRIARKAV